MDQTKFDVYQTVTQVVTELCLPKAMRARRGEQFTVSLKALRANGASAPVDIYVDRTPPGEIPVHFTTVDGAQVIGATASIDPDGERFAINIIVERSTSPHAAFPYIRVSQKMLRLLQARQQAALNIALERIIAEGE